MTPTRLAAASKTGPLLSDRETKSLRLVPSKRRRKSLLAPLRHVTPIHLVELTLVAAYYCVAFSPALTGQSRVTAFYLVGIPFIAYGLLTRIGRANKHERSVLFLVLAFAICVLLSELSADSREFAHKVYSSRMWVKILSFAALVMMFRDSRHLNFALNLVVYGGVFSAAVVLKTYRDNPMAFVGSRSDIYSDPNYLGIPLAAAFGILVCRLIKSELSWPQRALMSGGLCLILGAFSALSSRGAVVEAIGVSLGTVTLFVIRGVVSKRKAVVTLATVALLAGAFSLAQKRAVVDPSYLIKRLTLTIREGDLGNRETVIGAALKALDDMPLPQLVAGNGTGMGMVVIGQLTRGRRHDAHNSFITILLDHGLLGLAVFLALLGVGLRNIFRYEVQREAELLAIFLCLFLACLTVSPFSQDYVWFMFATLFATAPKRKRPATPDAQGRLLRKKA